METKSRLEQELTQPSTPCPRVTFGKKHVVFLWEHTVHTITHVRPTIVTLISCLKAKTFLKYSVESDLISVFVCWRGLEPLHSWFLRTGTPPLFQPCLSPETKMSAFSHTITNKNRKQISFRTNRFDSSSKEQTPGANKLWCNFNRGQSRHEATTSNKSRGLCYVNEKNKQKNTTYSIIRGGNLGKTKASHARDHIYNVYLATACVCSC